MVQMLDGMKYRGRLWKLQRGRDKTTAKFKKQIADSYKSKEGRHVREGILVNEQFELEEWDDEINSITTGYLLSQARRLILPIPNADDDWFVSETFGSRYLTPATVTKLRADIRAERKARWELFQSHAVLVISLTTALTGVLGAAIGFLSFMKTPPPH
jgi:hypothetical protein